MKYFLRVLLVLVLAVAVVFGMYYANSKGNTTRQGGDVTLTTVTKAPVTELKDDKILLAEYDEGFSLYKQEDAIILKDSEGEYSFDNWSKLITKERPNLYYADFDKDKDKEIILEVASRELDGGKFEHDLYLLDKTKGKYGDNKKEKYTVSRVSRDTWQYVLKELMIEEMTQLKCDKIIQFALSSAIVPIKYDPKSGINMSGYGGYFKALQNEDTGEYYRVKGWLIDNGEVYVNEKNKICCRVGIDVTYHGIDRVQKPGYIYFELLPSGASFKVTPRSTIFVSTDDSKVSQQHNWAYFNWNVIRENTSTAPYSSGDKVIDWVSFSLPNTETVSYSKMDFGSNNEVANLFAIDITNKRVKLIAKNGYTFDEKMAKRRDFEVVINRGMAGVYGENEISYDGKIYVDQNNRQVLEITFDKSYPLGEVHTFELHYPAQ